MNEKERAVMEQALEFCNFLWHVALNSVVPDNMSNGVVVTMWPLDDIEWVVKSGEEWTRPFFEAYNAVMEEIDATGVLVRFSW